MVDNKSNLEKQFLEDLEKFQKEIKAHLKKAEEELDKAVKISEKYGIPFDEGICFLNNTYVPESFEDKWGELDIDFLNDNDIYLGSEGCGWEYSAVCPS